MSEGQVVDKTETPATVESLQADFKTLGIEKGMVLLVHSSLSGMGMRRCCCCHHRASKGFR